MSSEENAHRLNNTNHCETLTDEQIPNRFYSKSKSKAIPIIGLEGL
jgi:hypothetical protein